ncbi:MAG: formylglycine-generating enzyme family protein [Bacteroidales bacterium]|nr:formylglycine-generating enzyme family protein [Bacteroidales bacterium]
MRNLLIILVAIVINFVAKAQNNPHELYQIRKIDSLLAIDNCSEAKRLYGNLLVINNNKRNFDLERRIDECIKKTQNPPIINITVNNISFNMIRVDGGSFQMGATPEQGTYYPENDEYPVHLVTLSTYYIGETEVTQELWQNIMENNPSQYRGDLQRPVEGASWNDCKLFIKILNTLTGKKFRLPTEAEWEYAARGGKKSRGYRYSGSDNLNDVAWYYDNSGNRTHPVKTKKPNELGLYDMCGSVWEWCSDWFGSYNYGSETNPQGPSTGTKRVLRGGCWGRDSKFCRISDRDLDTPSRGANHGLRLVLDVDE